ncbi:Aspartic peptidase [Gossypium australe]|uniref:Aspartic peptidase n=1 Tax=Gossypium australe TaxID=47621 RepID=A0A5B6V8Q5_9ROSI|nr:Aspartic peptidase [Gossypium australe]
MRVVASVGNAHVIILVDLGSTHNFIRARLVRQLAIPFSQKHKLKVMVANRGCNMVLGVQWFLSLGSFTWDFKALSMRFNHEGNECSLLGIQLGAI